MKSGIGIGAAALAIGAAAVPALVVAQQPARSVQQDFEAATALSEKSESRAAALAAWQALETRTKAGSRSHAIVQVRKGSTLFRLHRYDEAIAALRAGLAGLPTSDASLAEDRVMAQLELGAIAAETLDYAGAAGAYAAAEAAATASGDKLGAQLSLVHVQTFLDPAAARATMGRIDALAAQTKLASDARGLIEQRRAELQMNSNDLPAAKASAIRAVSAMGGLTERTSIGDVGARSDAAITLLLTGNRDEARRYMAMTGAGRLPKGRFNIAQQLAAPDCGGEAGLKPDDMAVVEFSIAEDGSTRSVTPVYSSGGGKVALAFAQAVRDWSWPVEDVAALPAFFRYNARVEMRCSTAFPRPAISDSFDQALAAWLTDKGAPVTLVTDGSDALALPAQRAALAAADARAPKSLAVLAALVTLANNRVVPREERSTLYERGLAIAEANAVPPLPRLALELPAAAYRSADDRKDQFQRAVTPLLSKPFYADDPQARAALRLALVDHIDSKRASANGDREVILRQIVDDGALAKDDALKVGALVRLASLQIEAGKPDAARSAFAMTGLDAQQCAVLDARPRMMSTPGAEAFPQEAQAWGFEGWTQVQYDIGADGRTSEPRTLLSYPPFIFSQAASSFMGKARFAKTYRPDGGLGCGGNVQRIIFQIPDK